MKFNPARHCAVAACLLAAVAAVSGWGQPIVAGVGVHGAPASGDTFRLAEAIVVRVTFDERVDVTGSPQLALTIGTTTRQASFDGLTGTSLWFVYFVQSSDSDTDGFAVGASALALNGGTITAAGSTTNATLGLGRFALGNANTYNVNGGSVTAPTVNRVLISDPPSNGSAYDLAETIWIGVAFDRAVTVSGSPQLALTIGMATRQAAYVRGADIGYLWFNYVVQPSDSDTDGLSIAAGALTLNGGTIRIRGGTTNATLGLGSHAIANSTSHQVDGSRQSAPAVSGALIGGAPESGDTYGLAESIWVRIAFDRPVDVTGAPRLALTIGSATRWAGYHTGSGTGYLWFRYIVQAADADANGISVGASALALNGGTIRFRGGTGNATLGLGSAAIANSADHKVDGSSEVAPTVAGVSIGSTPASGDTYGLSEPIWVRVAFSRPVDVTGTPQLALTIGSATQQASYNSGSGSSALWFFHVVQAADVDADGISIGASALTLNSGTITIRDGATNATLGLGTHAIANSTNHKVNGGTATAPAVASVSFAGGPASGDTYGLAEAIRVRVAFDRAVDVTGTPQLALTIGAATRQADFVSQTTAGLTLTFHYMVEPQDADADGISIGATALALNGGTITLRGGTANATLGLGSNAIANAANHKVDGSRQAPPVVSGVALSAPASGDTYTLGEAIWVQVVFDRAVDVLVGGLAVGNDLTRAPRLALTIGSATRQAIYQRGSGGNTLWFLYAVQASDRDANGISIGASALTRGGAAIRINDGTANAALGLGGSAIVDSANHKVDGSQTATPAVHSVMIASSPASGDTYGLSEVIRARIGFDRAVDVTGAPTLALTIGSASRAARLASQTAAGFVLTFEHVVLAADVDANGISIAAGALTLNSGTITIRGGATNATLGLGSRAIANSADHKVNGGTETAPAATSVAIDGAPENGATYGLAETIRVRIDFDRAVDVTGAPALALTIGSATRQAHYDDGSGPTLWFHYAVQPTDRDADGIGVAANALTLNGGTIRIRGGTMNAALGLGTPALANYRVDGSLETAPTVSGVAIGSARMGDTFTLASAIRVRIAFNKPVDVTGEPQLALAIGSATRQARYESGSGSDSLSFVHVVEASDSDPDGISIGASALTLNRGTIRINQGSANAALGVGSHAISNSANHKVDGSLETAPEVSGFFLNAPTSGDTFERSEVILGHVAFDNVVVVAGAPQLALTIGSATRQASYLRQTSLGNGIVFQYVVQAADADANGISVGATALALNGGSIRSRGGTANALLNLGSHAVADSASHVVDGSRATAPTVASATIVSDPAGGDYRAPAEIVVRVDFDRAVDVAGAPQLALTIGSATRQASYVVYLEDGYVARDPQALYFRYVVQQADRDRDGIGIGANALSLNGGTITMQGSATSVALDLGAAAISNAWIHKVASAASSAPTQVRAEATATGLMVTWAAATRATSYRVQWRRAGEAWSSSRQAETTATELEIEGLEPGSYEVRVVAVVDGQVGEASSAAEGEVARPANSPPRLTAELPIVEIDVGETQAVDLDSAFADPDNDVLRYSASSEDGAVSVWVASGAARIRGIRPGEATVTVTATDPAGLRATGTFRVLVGALLSLSGDAAAPEGATIVLTATLSRALAEPLDISWRIAPDDDPATPDADAGDYETAGAATIPAGRTSARIETAIVDDAAIEPAREHFVVALGEPQGPNVGLSRSARAAVAVQEGVCDRTPAVRDELARNWKGCHWPRLRDLSQVSTLDLNARGIAALRPDDLLGLSGLRHLDLRGNELAALPAELLSRTPRLSTLDLSANALEALPRGLFAGLGQLREVAMEGNSGAPFALAVQLTRMDAEPWAPGPATIAARAELGAPFAMAAPLVVEPAAAAKDGTPATVAIAAGEMAGTFAMASTDGAPLTLRTDPVPMPTTQCGGTPCFRGFETVPSSTLVLFHRPPQALRPPLPEPLADGDALRLPLRSLIALGDAPDGMRWAASSSDEEVATARIAAGDLLVEPEPGSEGTATITLTATDTLGFAATMRFEVRVEFHWPPRFGSGWRSALGAAAPSAEQ